MFGDSIAYDRVAMATFDMGAPATLMDAGSDGKGPLSLVLAGNRRAAYRPVEAIGGSDPAIRAMQEKLAALGYLDPRHVDGVVGRSRSATLDAVAAFQGRNGLKPDRELGGLNSLTRRKLAQPLGVLRCAS